MAEIQPTSSFVSCRRPLRRPVRASVLMNPWYFYFAVLARVEDEDVLAC